MRRAAILLAVLVLTGCTQRQVSTWLAWFQDDPEAARVFAEQPHIQTQLAARTTPLAPTVSTSRWDRVAWCESGGQWSHPPVHNRHGSFSGGLMIQASVWDHYGGQRYASDAWQATKGEQIVIAEAILDDVGWRAWQCR